MNIEDFEKQYGHVWCAGLQNNIQRNDFRHGMLKFTDEGHHILAGSFNGYGYYKTTEYLIELTSLQDEIAKIRFASYNFPDKCGYKNPAENEEHLQKRLEALTSKELQYWTTKVNNCISHIEIPTKENPFRLYICGNDDSSYSKFFPTKAQMDEELDLLELCQPIDFRSDLIGYVFTN